MSEMVRRWDLDDLQASGLSVRPDPERKVESVGPVVVDHGMVRLLRREVADQLAARLQTSPVSDASTRRELCRSLLADVVAAHAAERARAGQQEWGVAEEFALADAVMSALWSARPERNA